MVQTASKDIWLNVDGLHIHCLKAGENGSPVILLHGGGIDSACISWGAAIGPLSARHQVFAPDLPGYGESDRPPIEYTMDYYVHFLEHFMDAAHLERASLVGLSLGGGIALNFTLSYQSRVDRLVLVDPYYGFKGPWDWLAYLYIRMSFLQEFALRMLSRDQKMIRWSLKGAVRNPQNLSQELLDAIYQEARKQKRGEAFASFQKSEITRGGLRSDTTNRLHDITVPTLIINGEKDPLVPVSYARKAHTLIKNSELYILRDCGHWTPREKPEEFSEIVGSFLQ
jgi:pimeloyl-ACP methyl ester carboxylesterase